MTSAVAYLWQEFSLGFSYTIPSAKRDIVRDVSSAISSIWHNTFSGFFCTSDCQYDSISPCFFSAIP